MPYIKSVREKLGLSLQQLAAITGLPKSTIAMCERGQREIPTLTLQKLARIEALFQQYSLATKATTVTSHSQPGADATNKIIRRLQQQARKAAWAAGRCQLQLEKMQQTHTQASAMLSVIQTLLQETPANNISHAMLELEILKWVFIQQKNSLTEQVLLQYQLELLQGQREAAERAVERWGKK